MSTLFGGSQRTSTTADKLAGIQIMTSTYGDCIPVAFGTPRITAKLSYYQDFTAIPHTSSQRTGKGGGSTQTNTTYTYTVAAIMVLCEGPAVALRRAWADKDTVDDASTLGFSFFNGEATQSPWGYVTSAHPTEAVGYGGMCYVAKAPLDLSDTGGLKNYSFEVKTSFTYAADGLDEYLGTIIYQALTNPTNGMGWSTSQIDWVTVNDFQNYCVAANIAASPVFIEQRSAIETLSDLLKVGNCAVFPSDGVLKFVPYQDTPVGSWYPNSTPVYDLTYDDFIRDGDSYPITVTRSTQADAYNRVQVEFLNRSKDHAAEIAEASDQANVENFGLRGQDPISLHMITNPVIARDTAQRILQRLLYVRNTYEFQLGPRHMLLEPMTLCTVTDLGLGLDHAPVRILSCEDGEDGSLSVVAEEWPFGVATATRYPTPVGSSTGADSNAAPGSVLRWGAFEAPGSLTAGRVEVWVGARGGPNWGGCNVWASRDGSTYSVVGTINAPARFGSLTYQLSAAQTTQGQDLSAILYMTATAQFLPLSDADAAKFQGLSWVGGEFLAYQDAALQWDGSYQLRKLWRGLHGSSAQAHAPGSQLIRCDDALLHLDAKDWEAGATIYFKFQSFNLVGGKAEDLSACPAQSFLLTGLALHWPAPTSCAIVIDNTGAGTTGGGGGTSTGTGGTSTPGGTTLPTLTGALASIRYSSAVFPSGPTAGSITASGEASISRAGGRACYYLFTLANPATVRVTMLGDNSLDTYVVLWNTDSTLIAQNDDTGGVYWKSEVYQALPAGSYVVECCTYNSAAMGTFNLTLGAN